MVVMESLQRVNVTIGKEATLMVMVLDVAGFPIGHVMFEVRMQET